MTPRKAPPDRKVSVHIMLPVEADQLLTEIAWWHSPPVSRSTIVEELIRAEAYRLKIATPPTPA